jgi:hypothetical protein
MDGKSVSGERRLVKGASTNEEVNRVATQASKQSAELRKVIHHIWQVDTP